MKGMILSCCVALFVSLFLNVTQSGAEDKSITVTFDAANLSFQKLDSYDLVELKGADQNVQAVPGTPLLPVPFVRVAVPETAVFQSLTVGTVDSERLEGSYYLYPTQTPTRFDRTPSFTPPDPKTYGLTTKYPGSVVEYVQTGTIAGWKSFVFKINALQYIPASKEVWFNKAITFTFSYAQSLDVPETPPSKEQMKDFFKSIVVNPGDVSESESPARLLASTEVAYLIVTNNALASAFEQLRKWKTNRGISTQIITTESIASAYPGVDLQEKIRNAFKDYWLNRSTLYVLLGGDDTIIPVRYCKVTAPGYPTEDHPTDLYYSGLDGSWDENHNGIFCEELSGDPDQVDLEPDVFVGRAAVQTAAQAEAFISKIIQYEQNAPSFSSFSKRILLTGVKLFDYATNPQGYTHSPVSDAEVELDSLATSRIAPYYKANVFRLYDTFTNFDTLIAGDYGLTAGHLEDKINDGYNLVTMYTHGSETVWTMENGAAFSTTNASLLRNSQRAGIIYTIACTTNHFDQVDPSLSEAFIRNPNGGAVAYIGSSRYGWSGVSEPFAEEFYYQLLGQKNYILGQAFAKHKLAKASASKDVYYRWLQFSLNLLGDPTMQIWLPPGDVVVSNDEWPLSDEGGFTATPTAATQFAVNLANQFSGGAPGKFLAYSTPFGANNGLVGKQLANTMVANGHKWDVMQTSAQFTLQDLLKYDGVFLAGVALPTSAQIDDFLPLLQAYVIAGGNVYLAGGTELFQAAPEAARWNPFLNSCGLRFESVHNNIGGVVPILSTHPVFNGVQSLYQDNGNSITKLDPSDPEAAILAAYQGQGLYATCSFTSLEPWKVNDFVNFVRLTDTYQTDRDPSGCPDGDVGKFRFNAQLISRPGTPPLRNLKAKVAALGNNNLVYNADGGLGGVNATVTFGPIDDYSDGVLTELEDVRLPFSICLTSFNKFDFLVDVLGQQ